MSVHRLRQPHRQGRALQCGEEERSESTTRQKILSFRMLCHCEDGTSRTDQRRNPHWIEIHTDPKNAEYVVADGAVRVSDPSLLTPAELGVEATLDEEEAGKRARRTHSTGSSMVEAARRRTEKKPWLEQLQDQRDDNWHNDYDANRLLRKQHRTKRDAALMRQADAAAKGRAGAAARSKRRRC